MESESHLVDDKLIDWLLNSYLDWDVVTKLVTVLSEEVELELMGLKQQIWVEFRHDRNRDLELEDRSW